MDEDVVQGKDEPMSKDLFMLVRRCPGEGRGEGEGRGDGSDYSATGNLFTKIQTTTKINTTFEELESANKNHHIS
jgi:hypothetical protein